MRTSTKIVIGGAAIYVTGILVGCSGGLTADVGGAAKSAVDHGAAIAAEGWSEGNPVKGVFGSLLQLVGGAAALGGGVGMIAGKKAATVADKKIATYDAAPDTAHFAPDGSIITPAAPKV